MRPTRLEIEGFTCYREKQVVDFKQLSLFAIAGPTGAGKSSILDAMAFALYGRIPRMGAQNLDEFISLGAARAVVVLEFTAQGTEYRVVRSMPRSGQKKVQLESVTGGRARALADGNNEVNTHLTQVLGLDYDAFLQAVLLPQGEFARFLKSKPAEQREMLRDLLRLNVYERMRARALGQARELETTIAADQRLLDEHYAEATPENLSTRRDALGESVLQRSTAADSLASFKAEHSHLQAKWKEVQERAEYQRKAEELDRDQPEMDALATVVRWARAAAEVQPLLAQANQREQDLRQAETDAQEAAASLRSVVAELQDLAISKDAAQREFDQLPMKRERLLALKLIVPVVSERRGAAAKIASALAEQKKTEEELAEARRQFAESEKAAGKLRAQRDELEAKQQSLGHDVTILDVLKNAMGVAYALGQAKEQQTELADAARTAEAGVQRAARARLDQEPVVSEAKNQHEQAAKAVSQARAELDAVYNRDRAATLRLTLQPGCTCPVCEQTVAEVPAGLYGGDVDDAKQRLAQLTELGNMAAQRWQQAQEAAARLQAAEHAARVLLSQREGQVETHNQKTDRLLTDLRNALHSLWVDDGLELDEFVIAECRRRERIAGQWNELVEQLHGILRKLQEAEGACARHQLTIDKTEHQRSLLAQSIGETRGKLAECDRQIEAVAAADPEGEVERLGKQICAVEKHHAEVCGAFEKTRSCRHEAELAARGAEGKLTMAKREYESASQAAHAAVHGAGFASRDAVNKAARTLAEISAADAQLREFASNREKVNARLQALAQSLQGVSVTEADVRDSALRLAEAEQAVSRLDEGIGRLRQEVEALERLTAEAGALRVAHQERKAQHQLFQRLAQDLGGKAFQQYLLDGSFARLVEGASHRLRELNERYELRFADNKFVVLDHDHGAQPRLADTLSGGETFLVSLALALELSEQVQRAAGAVRLDSLFIDEGFGTLDPETLETVAEAIENLSKSNRMIGVITHVPELHRRLPRLEVTPSAAGSTIRYVEE